MSKRFTSVFLAMLLCMAGKNVFAQQNDRLSFGVISDIHIENNKGQGAMYKVPRALKNLTSHKPLDAIAIVGDVSNAGNADEFEKVASVFKDASNFTNPVGTLLFMMGNHDNVNANGTKNYQEGLKDFNGGDNYPLHQYKVIKGYPFITISMRTSSSNDTGNDATGKAAYPDDVVKQLETWLEQASKECPGKPIFVFTHVPPRWTVYGSWPEYENGNGWAMKVLNPVLNKYPQAVVFAGHTHYPLGDPRSIHQGANPNSEHQNYFTVVNTASTTYSEINPGEVDAGTHPAGYSNITEGLIVNELENGDIEICRYDTYRNLEIGAEHRWVLKAPFDGSKFEYADIRDADDNPNNVPLWNGLPAPVFSKSAQITVKPMAYDATVLLPQATDNECVFRYRVRLSKGGLVLSEKFIFSQFYLNTDMPDPLQYYIPDLKPDTEYELEVVAYDSYNNASTPLTTTFQTPAVGDDNVLSAPDGQWKFEDGSNLLKPEQGNLSLQPCVVGKKQISVAESLGEAGIAAIEGSTDDNKAILVPKNAALKLNRVSESSTTNYTIMMDVKMADAASYNGLLQTNISNNNDGDMFVSQNKVGINAIGGYFGEIKDNTWYRIVMTNRDGRICVYVDGEKVLDKNNSDGRWEIDPWGFYLFCDDDGEMTDTEVSEVAFWEKGLSENQVRKLCGLEVNEEEEEEAYLKVKTPNVRLVNDKDFTITVDANVGFTFDLPDWVEPVEVTPFLGENTYTFRANPQEMNERYSGTITISGENVESQQVEVVAYTGDDIPEEMGLWSFDNKSNLLDGSGCPAILRGSHKTAGGPEYVTDLASIGIVPTAGPTDENGAITIPKDSYLWFLPNADADVLRDYTILYDIKPANLNGYKALFQADIKNLTDAGLFFKNNQVGLGGSIGYVGNLQADKWYRLLFVVKNSKATLYLDGTKVGESTVTRDLWNITKEALLFADNDGEEGPVDVAGIRFWDLPLSATHAKRLGDVFKDAEEYFKVQTTGIRLICNNRFSINVNSNVPFSFEFPEWIEAVDTAFVTGEKDYTFLAANLEEVGRRKDVVTVQAEYFEPAEVVVEQVKMGETLPEATGCWTFDNPSNLMEGTGTATIKAALKTENGPEVTDNPSYAEIESVDGPSEQNKAIGVPVPAYLMLYNNTGFTELKDYTISMDVCPMPLQGYHALVQNNPRNDSDAGFFVKNNTIGLNYNGLGYGGYMQEGKWHRIVLVVKDGFAYTYLDGESVGASTSANYTLWTMQPQTLLFADDNDEDGYNEVAEVRFWDVPLTADHVKKLGAVDQEWEDDPMEEPVSVWTFDDATNLLAGTGTATLRAAVKGAAGPEATDDLTAAGIVPVLGPTATNGAVTVPVDTYLQFAHNQDDDQSVFTFMMDIRPKSLAVYNALFQSQVLNNKDASLFINKNKQLGYNSNGLGYGGKLEDGKWHRIIFTILSNSITTYLDGKKIGSSTSANADKWILHNVAYFFADEDGEEGVVDIAELRYWDVAIDGIHALKLGGVEADDEVGIPTVEQSAFNNGNAVYDITGRLVDSRFKIQDSKLKKGLYIMNGKKFLVK